MGQIMLPEFHFCPVFFSNEKKVGAVLESRKIIKTEPPLKCFRSGIKNWGRPNNFRRSSVSTSVCLNYQKDVVAVFRTVVIVKCV